MRQPNECRLVWLDPMQLEKNLGLAYKDLPDSVIRAKSGTD